MDKRLASLRAAMRENGLDAALATSLTAIRYFSGFTSVDATLVITGKSAVLLTDFRYTIQAKEQAGDYFEIREIKQTEWLDQISRILTADDAQAVGFEEDVMSVAVHGKLASLPFAFHPFAEQMHRLRLRKSAYEVSCLQKAQAIADKSFAALLERIHIGMTEKEVAAELTYLGSKFGSEGPSFDPIVGSGPNGAMCHAVPSDRKLREGDLVVIDFGCIYNGYHSDMTRTIAVGEVDDTSRKIYAIVLEAHQRALAAVKAGVTGKALDAVARDYITEQGYGDCFGHSLGHGFGLLIHEEPRASIVSDTPLEAGMTVTIEPGVYIEGKCGVRIEDCVIVTGDGCLDLVSAKKELIQVR